jgi:hypothetical protein
MAEQKFAWFPVTMERPLTGRIILVNAAFYDPDTSEAAVEDDYSGHEYTVATIVAHSDQEFRFLTEADETIILRPTRPDDAAASDRFANRIPLPVEIIGAVMTNSISEPTISAAIDDQGDVHTMILETGLGLYARYAASWIRMTDISPIEQLDIVDVPADDLEAYDQADQRGDVVNIRYLHPIDWPGPSAVETTPAPTVASAAPIPTVASVADLPDAVEFAKANADSRWYVERKWRALGAEDTGVTLPWLNGAEQ